MTAADRRGGKGRILGVDAARAIALIGMMAVHLLPSTDPDGSISTAYFLASGRSSALFAVLAGVGLALATGGLQPPSERPRWAAAAGLAGRAVVLGLVGLFLGDLNSGVAVILVNYAFLFLVGILFLHLPAPRLLLLAAIWVTGAPFLSHWLRLGLPASSFDVTGFHSLIDPIKMLRELFFTGYYPVFTWVAYLLAGLAIGRTALTTRYAALRLLIVGLGLGAGSVLLSRFLLDGLGGRAHLDELPVQFFGVTPTDTWWYLAVVTPHSGTPLDFAHTIGTSLVILGACLLVAVLSRRMIAWLAAAGGMTFSLYTAQVLALSAGWGLSDRYTLLIWNVVLALIIAWVWRAFVGRGPLETLTANVAGVIRAAVLARVVASPKAN